MIFVHSKGSLRLLFSLHFDVVTFDFNTDSDAESFVLLITYSIERTIAVIIRAKSKRQGKFSV